MESCLRGTGETLLHSFLVSLEVLEEIKECKKLGLTQEDIDGYVLWYIEGILDPEVKPMIYEYECTSCGFIQEVWHKLNDKNNKPCEKCSAPSKGMKRIMSLIADGHGSWGRWKV